MKMEILRDSGKFLFETVLVLCKDARENTRNHLLSISM